MRLGATKCHLRGQERKVVEAVGYFCWNRRHICYHEYLQQDWPIAASAVEKAGKKLVKDRIEHSGMRWALATAEAMLPLRAF
jgi:hypothetical protein